MSELIDGKVYLTAGEAAAAVGWKRESFTAYVFRGRAPKPARRIAGRPLWLKSDITKWRKNLPGKGYRTDLARKR